MTSTGRPPPRRVFLSFTMELARFPPDRSFVQAAQSAITRVGDVVLSTDAFAAFPEPPEAVTLDSIRAADVFVLIVGFRAGAQVPGGSERSYPELEFDTATELGLPRLVFLLDENTALTRDMVDVQADRIDAFRRRLRSSTVVATVSTPHELEVELLHALTALPRGLVEPIPPPPRIHVEPAPVRLEEPAAPAPLRRRPPVPRPPSVPADVDTLAALLSPASRVEPELLRAVRLECLPELPVDAEQELWFGPLVDARSDGGITFAPEEIRELRSRLRALHAGDGRALVERAREVQGEVHAGISPLLRLEEELAWHEVVGDAAGAAEAADVAVRAVAARRDGAVHWVERVWSTLPESVRDTPTGWVLGHVAGARDGLPATPGLLADHHLEALLAAAATVRMGLARSEGLLRLGVPLDEADATIDLPDTRPRVVEVGEDPPRRVLVGEGEIVEVPVGDRPVGLRTLAGDVYLLGDDRSELIDSVLVEPSGAWCVVRLTTSWVVVGHSGDLSAALAAVAPVRRTPVDLLPSVGRERPPSVGGLLVVGVTARAAATPPASTKGGAELLSEGSTTAGGDAVSDAAFLPRRPQGAVELDATLRTLGRAPSGVEVVTVRSASRHPSGVVLVDPHPADLVVGAPVVDDGDRLVGVVAPWGTDRAVLPSSVWDQVLERVGDGRPATSRQLLHVDTDTARDSERLASFEFGGRTVADAARDATSLWLAGRDPSGRGVLVCRFGRVEVTSVLGILRRRVRAADPEVLPANDATALLGALGAGVGTSRLLDEDEARLVEAFVAGLQEPAGRPAEAPGSTGARPAARVGDPTGHPGVIGPPGVPTVLIGGMPAATVGTPHICSFPPPAVHPPTVVVPPGSATVLIGGMPAARIGDLSGCGAPIVIGSPTVLIG